MKQSYSEKPLPDSALRYLLEALIPYTEANIKLAFKPSAFFNDLEKIDRQKAWQQENQNKLRHYNRGALSVAFYRAKKKHLITLDQDGNPRLTDKGRQQIRPYQSQKLAKSTRLMVVFDIPEEERIKRRHLRTLLKELNFEMIQQSVWTSEYDHREFIKDEIKAYDLEQYVLVYECARII